MLQELEQRALRRLAKLPLTLPSTYLRDVPIAKGIRNVLFPLHVIDTDVSRYDAAPDGQRFLVLDPGICRRRRRSSTGRRCRLRQLTESQYSLSPLRYDLSKLRAKDLVEKLRSFHTPVAIELPKKATRSVWYISSSSSEPMRPSPLDSLDSSMEIALWLTRNTIFDRLYQCASTDLGALLHAVDLKIAA
jgi:hypothetical protein